MQSPQQTHHHRLTAPPGHRAPGLLLEPAQPPACAQARLPARPTVLSADPARGTAMSPAYLASLSCLKLSQTPRQPGGSPLSWGQNPRGGRGPRRTWSKQPAHPGQFHSLGRAALLTASFSKETGSDQTEAHYPQRSLGRGSVRRPAHLSPSSQACAALVSPAPTRSFQPQVLFSFKTHKQTCLYSPGPRRRVCDTRSCPHQALLGQAPSQTPKARLCGGCRNGTAWGGKLWSLSTWAAGVLV